MNRSTQQAITEISNKFLKEVIKRGTNIFPPERMETIRTCIQCGTCVGSCPSGRRTAWRVRNIIQMLQLGLREEVLNSDDLWLCTTCYTCQERCPRNVATTDIIRILRNIAFEEGHAKKAHLAIVNNFLETGHSIPITDEVKKARIKLGLEEVPPTTLKSEKSCDEIDKILKATGFREKIPK